GYEYVYGIAADFGFTEGLYSIADQLFGAPADPTTDSGEAVSSSGGGDDAETVSPPDGTTPPAGSGPTPFPYTDPALADLLASQNPDWKFTPDKGWVKLESGVYVPNQCIIDPIGRTCSAVGDPYRAQGQVGIDVAMKSHKIHVRVEQKLRSHPLM